MLQPDALEMASAIATALEMRDVGSRFVSGLNEDFSNAPTTISPTLGSPLGGLLAALASHSARRQFNIATPLQALSVQFLARSKFEDIHWNAGLLRGGRKLAYVDIEGRQRGRLTLKATAFFSPDMESSLFVSRKRVAPPEELTAFDRIQTTLPWFARYLDLRFAGEPGLFGAFADEEPRFCVWARWRDGAPIDENRLCMLLDALYPAFWTILPSPPLQAVTTNLNYEFASQLDPSLAPDGWIYLEFELRHLAGGLAVEDGVAYCRSGAPIAFARQRRKLLARSSIPHSTMRRTFR